MATFQHTEPRFVSPQVQVLEHACAFASARSPAPQEVDTHSRNLELGREVRAILAEKFAERISLDWLSAEIGVSKFHLCRVFREATGMTISSYLHRLRLAEALRRLAGGERDLSRLAAELGYSSHSHFTAVFRRDIGSTPSSIRELLFP